MGNNIYHICGGPKKDGAEWQIEGDTQMSPADVENKVVKIQNKVRAHLIKNELKDIEKLQMKEFDDNIVNFGKYILEDEMNELISENVQRVEAILKPFTPTEEELAKYKHVFVRGPILFNDGSVYKGSWNYLGKKQGYGIYIRHLGSKYEGFWFDDKIQGRGRFIDEKGNYYEGNFKIF
jgi:hypothetical protein